MFRNLVHSCVLFCTNKLQKKKKKVTAQHKLVVNTASARVTALAKRTYVRVGLFPVVTDFQTRRG